MTEINWWVSFDGPTTGYGHELWDENDVLHVYPGQAFWVRVMAVSGETVENDWAHANLVVPEELVVLKFNGKDGSYEAPYKGSANDQVGTPPNHEVAWFAAERRWMPHFAWPGIFLVRVPHSEGTSSDEFTLLYDISDGGSHQSKRRIRVDF